MQHPQAQLGSGPRPNPQAADAQNPEGASPDSRNHEALLADARLVKRCLAGEPAAWEEFYAQCHRPLLLSIEVMLGPDHADPNLVDEIAARVWYALLENDGRLLAQYDPNRGGRLITFLQTVARTGVRRHFRRERRRQNRERIALLGKSRHQRPDDAQMTALIGEFLPTLTAREREVCERDLLARPAGGGRGPRTSGNWPIGSAKSCSAF